MKAWNQFVITAWNVNVQEEQLCPPQLCYALDENKHVTIIEHAAMFKCKPVQAFFILYFEQPTCFCWYGYSGVSDTNLAVHSDFNLTAIPIILSPTWSFFNVHFFQAKCTYIGLFLRISSTYFKLIVLISSELHLFRANYTYFKSTAPISSQFLIHSS